MSKYFSDGERTKKVYENNYTGYYSSFIGSPLSHGVLQYDMWGVSLDQEEESQFNPFTFPVNVSD